MLLPFRCQFFSSATLPKDFRRQSCKSSALCSSLADDEKDEEAENKQAPGYASGIGSA